MISAFCVRQISKNIDLVYNSEFLNHVSKKWEVEFSGRTTIYRLFEFFHLTAGRTKNAEMIEFVLR